VLFRSILFKLFVTNAILFKLFGNNAILFKLFGTNAILFKLFGTNAILFKLFGTNAILFKLFAIIKSCIYRRKYIKDYKQMTLYLMLPCIIFEISLRTQVHL